MAITAQEVKRLRDITGVGMMDCKKALQEANGDFDTAIDLLRKKGQKVAAKRADREAKEGVIVTAATSDQKTALLVEVNCETDFVARNEEFQKFANALGALVLETRPADRDTLMATPFDKGRTVEEALIDQTGKIGEKIDVRRFAIMTSEDGQVVAYIHPGARLGVLVETNGTGDLETAGRDVAMQVAALNPIAASREEVTQEIKDYELEIGRETARAEGKPEQIIERIAEGKLNRYYKDYVLLEQPFVKDASTTVADMLKQAGASIKGFIRFALGD